MNWIAEHWQWIAGALLLALAIGSPIGCAIFHRGQRVRVSGQERTITKYDARNGSITLDRPLDEDAR